MLYVSRKLDEDLYEIRDESGTESFTVKPGSNELRHLYAHGVNPWTGTVCVVTDKEMHDLRVAYARDKFCNIGSAMYMTYDNAISLIDLAFYDSNSFYVSGSVNIIDLNIEDIMNGNYGSCIVPLDEDDVRFTGKTIILPNNGIKIGACAFASTNIRVRGLGNISYVGDFAFSCCPNLGDVLKFDKLTGFGFCALAGCNASCVELPSLCYSEELGMNLFGDWDEVSSDDSTACDELEPTEYSSIEYILEDLFSLLKDKVQRQHGKWHNLSKLVLNKTIRGISERELKQIFGIRDTSIIEFMN